MDKREQFNILVEINNKLIDILCLTDLSTSQEILLRKCKAYLDTVTIELQSKL